MAEKADLECSGQKGDQDVFLWIRFYKILIANEITEAVDDTVAGQFTSGLTFNCFVNKDLIGEKPAEMTICNIVPGIRPLPL